MSGGVPVYRSSSSSSNSHSSPYLQGNDHDRSAYTTALYTYILNSLHDEESASSPPLLPPLDSLPSSASSLLSLFSSPGCDHRLLIPTPSCSSSPTLTDPSSKQPSMLPFSSSLPPALLHCEAFLLGRLGRFSEALHILVEDLADIPAAVSLAWESSDPSVWKILVSAIVVQRPCYITEMMDSLDDHLKGTSSAYTRRNEGSWWESDDDVVFLTTTEGKRDERRGDHRHDDHPMLLLKKERGFQSSHEENRHKNFNVDRSSHHSSHSSSSSSSFSRSRRPSSSDKCEISNVFSSQLESSRSPHASVYSPSQRGETGWREEQTMKKKGLSKEPKTEEKEEEEDAKGDKGQGDKGDISEGQGKRQKAEKEVDHLESEDPKTEDERRRRKGDALVRVATSPRKGGDNEKKRETSLRSSDLLEEEEEAHCSSEESISVKPTTTIESSSHSLLPPSKSSTHEKQEDLLSSSSSSPPSISTEPRAISQIPSREDKIAQEEEEETGQVRSRRRREGERRGFVGEKAHTTAHSDEGGGAAAVAALLAPLHLLKSLPSHAIHLIPRLQRRLSPLFKQRQLKEDFWTAANACLEEDLKLLGRQLLLRRRRGVAICPGAASPSSSSLTGASLYQNQHYATSSWTGSNTTGGRRAGGEGEEGKRSFMMMTMMNRGETRGKAGEKNSMYLSGDGGGIGEGEDLRYLSFENARSKYDREKTQQLLKAVRKRIEELEREMKEEERERRRIFSEGEVRKEGETPRSSRCGRRDMMRMVDGNEEMRETSVQGKQRFSAGKRGTSLFPTEGYRGLASSDFEERILMKLSQKKQTTPQKKRANTDIVLSRVSPKLSKDDHQGILKKTEEGDLSSSSFTTSSPSLHPRHNTLPSSTIDGNSSLFLSLQKSSIPSSEQTLSSLEKSHLLSPYHRKNHSDVSIEDTKTPRPPRPPRHSGPINSNPSSLSTSVLSSSSASSSYIRTLQEHEEVEDNETEASLDGAGGEGMDEHMTTHTRGSTGRPSIGELWRIEITSEGTSSFIS